jgi:N-methylhydantoinase A
MPLTSEQRQSDWSIGVDIGGTFTDVVLWRDGAREMRREKLLTTPDDPSRAVIEGVRRALDRQGIAAAELGTVVHGTTLVANALIERRGVTTGLVTTRGFRDVLGLGREWRYDLYDLAIALPAPLVPRALCFEVTERRLADGSVETPLDESDVIAASRSLRAAGVEAVAVAFLHSYRDSSHERRAGEILAAELPGVEVSLSSDVSPVLGEYERSSTVAANAYVLPIFAKYVERLEQALLELGFRHDLLLVLSDGRCIRAETARRYPIRLVQSGPAAGAEAARMFGELAGEEDVLCFDMGGTTAKACLIHAGEPERTSRFEVARETRFAEGSGLPLQIPAIDMIEIGAGGGSIAEIDARGLIQVGPRSAGAAPGPACYGRGNPKPTVTDCDLVLGYLDAASFLGGTMPLDKSAAEAAIQNHLAEPLGISVVEAAWGVHETVTANMAQAATIHTIERGLDVTRFAMLPIGGAGPVHACSMASKMNIDRLVCPVGAGVASAIGMLAAPVSFEVGRSAPCRLDALDVAAVRAVLAELRAEAEGLVKATGIAQDNISCRMHAMMRYVGQGYEIEVAFDPDRLAANGSDELGDAFTTAYRVRYGRSETAPSEILSWRVVASGPRPALAAALALEGQSQQTHPVPHARRQAFFTDLFVETPVYRRANLMRGQTLDGPAIIEEDESTLVVPLEFALAVDPALNLVAMRRTTS